MRPIRSQLMRVAPRRAAGLRLAGRRRTGARTDWARAAMPGATRPGPAFLHLGAALDECVQAGEGGRGAQFLLDPQQPVVLGDAVRARGGAGLDLTGAGGDGEV